MTAMRARTAIRVFDTDADLFETLGRVFTVQTVDTSRWVQIQTVDGIEVTFFAKEPAQDITSEALAEFAEEVLA